VRSLQNQLNFVLSFLGITDNLFSPTNVPAGQMGLHNQTDNSISNGATVSSSSSSSNSVPADASVNNENSVPSQSQQSREAQSYADTVRKPAALSAPLRHAVVSAVYADIEEKDRRAKNIVISGMPSSAIPDKTFVENLCLAEFEF